MSPSVLLLGGGRMGSALVAGWRAAGLGAVVVVDPAPLPGLGRDGVVLVSDAASVPAGFTPHAVVLAVKPQSADAAVPGIARFAAGAVLMSIMAGRTTSSIAALTGAPAIVRAMPNTPAAIGRGFTAAFAGRGVSAEQQALCHRLLEAIGEVAWLPREDQLDAVTAISGSGPAYVFLLAELLEAEAIEQGLPPDLARRMARRTVCGSGALLDASNEQAAAMRRAVTSPGGTTERALAVLMAPGGWPETMRRAVAAATARSRELSS